MQELQPLRMVLLLIACEQACSCSKCVRSLYISQYLRFVQLDLQLRSHVRPEHIGANINTSEFVSGTCSLKCTWCLTFAA